MNLKTVQFFNDEYLEKCKELSPDQIIEFLENFRELCCERVEKCQLISIKIEPSLLHILKCKAQLDGIPYQTLIKRILRKSLRE